MAGPLPRQLEGPQQGDHLTQVLQTREHQTSVPERQEKHGEEEQPKPVPESPALHPPGMSHLRERPKRPPSMASSCPRPQ